jgi:hypothetical protein
MRFAVKGCPAPEHLQILTRKKPAKLTNRTSAIQPISRMVRFVRFVGFFRVNNLATRCNEHRQAVAAGLA